MENQDHTSETTTSVDSTPKAHPPRFRAGKLIMISPKHKENFQKRPQTISFMVFKELKGGAIPEYYRRGNKTTGFKWNGFEGEVDFWLQGQSHLQPGVPILLLDDPKEVGFTDFHPDREHVYSTKTKKQHVRGWQIRFMLTDKVTGQISMCHAIVSNKIWKHYLCVVVPRRAEKYGIE